MQVEPAVAVPACVLAACASKVLAGDCEKLVQQLVGLALQLTPTALASQAAIVAAASIVAKLPQGMILTDRAVQKARGCRMSIS